MLINITWKMLAHVNALHTKCILYTQHERKKVLQNYCGLTHKNTTNGTLMGRKEERKQKKTLTQKLPIVSYEKSELKTASARRTTKHLAWRIATAKNYTFVSKSMLVFVHLTHEIGKNTRIMFHGGGVDVVVRLCGRECAVWDVK